MKVYRKILALAGAAALVACTAYAPTAVRKGQTADEVALAMGPPTGRYTFPDGTIRLEYARGPYGKHTWMIDLDRDGRVADIFQVLYEENFTAITPGMKRDEVLIRLGRPSEDHGARGGVRLWSYRYETPVCQWFVVSMNPNGVVRDTGYAIDRHCDAGDMPGWK